MSSPDSRTYLFQVPITHDKDNRTSIHVDSLDQFCEKVARMGYHVGVDEGYVYVLKYGPDLESLWSDLDVRMDYATPIEIRTHTEIREDKLARLKAKVVELERECRDQGVDVNELLKGLGRTKT